MTSLLITTSVHLARFLYGWWLLTVVILTFDVRRKNWNSRAFHLPQAVKIPFENTVYGVTISRYANRIIVLGVNSMVLFACGWKQVASVTRGQGAVLHHAQVVSTIYNKRPTEEHSWVYHPSCWCLWEHTWERAGYVRERREQRGTEVTKTSEELQVLCGKEKTPTKELLPIQEQVCPLEGMEPSRKSMPYQLHPE